MNNSSCKKNETRIAADILRYLLRNPQAQDTLAGITNWWLMSQQIEDAICEVSGALDFLLAEGLILAREFHNQQRYYQLNQDRISEIEVVLNEMQKNE